MKQTNILFLLLPTFLLVGCHDSRRISDIELYGNTFIHIGNEAFFNVPVPESWVTL